MELVNFSLVCKDTNDNLSGFSFLQKRFIIKRVEQKGKPVFLWD